MESCAAKDAVVTGVLVGTIAAARRMASGGHVVNIGSLAAADELAPRGIAVTVLCPGPVRTAMLAKQIVEAVLDVIERRPLQRCLPPLRGLLASVAGALPRFWRLCLPVLRRQGRAAQAKLRPG